MFAGTMPECGAPIGDVSSFAGDNPASGPPWRPLVFTEYLTVPLIHDFVFFV
jgi:hypothetical protein